MAEVALVWYSMADDAVTANRAQVRRWAGELGLPTGPMSKSNSVVALRKAAEETWLEFESQGQTCVLEAKQTAQNDNFVTYTVYGKPSLGPFKRLGEVKLFLARRSSKGMISDSERLKTLIGASASEPERTAMQSWLQHFTSRYEELQGVAPQIQVRAIVRQHLNVNAFPVAKHKFGIYFAYVDRLPVIRRAQVFLSRSAPHSSFTVLPIEAGPEQHQLFAAAADEHVESTIDALIGRVQGRERMKAAGKRAAQWRVELAGIQQAIEEHEVRLGLGLPAARARLGLAHQAVDRINPTADLLSVTG